MELAPELERALSSRSFLRVAARIPRTHLRMGTREQTAELRSDWAAIQAQREADAERFCVREFVVCASAANVVPARPIHVVRINAVFPSCGRCSPLKDTSWLGSNPQVSGNFLRELGVGPAPGFSALPDQAAEAAAAAERAPKPAKSSKEKGKASKKQDRLAEAPATLPPVVVVVVVLLLLLLLLQVGRV